MDTPHALVTGASSGIGRAFARTLAARGYDVTISARREDRLQAIAAAVADVAARLVDPARPIDLLVNNAGFGTAGALWELDADGEEREIHVNVVAVVRLTQAALGAMVARGRGGVINVSSVAAYQPTPWGATYGATKAFVSSFTNAVHEELRGTGVRVMVLAPGYTHTEFHEQAAMPVDQTPELLWQSPETVVDAALRAYERGRVVCTPGALNTMAAAFSGSLPAGISRRVAGVVTRRTH